MSTLNVYMTIRFESIHILALCHKHHHMHMAILALDDGGYVAELSKSQLMMQICSYSGLSIASIHFALL